MATKGNEALTYLTIAAIAGGGLWWMRKSRKKPAPVPGPVVPPAPPRPGEGTPDIQFETDGETQLTLPAGEEFSVTWDPASPWRYVPQDTETIQALDPAADHIRFHVAVQMPTGNMDQVYVQAVDEEDNVLGEHKITVFGP